MQIFTLHPQNPQERLVKQIAQRIKQGQISAIPTDSGYALVSALENHLGRERILRIRALDEDHFFTLLCHNLEDLSIYAKLSNVHFKLLKRLTPGAYTFILPSTNEVPKKLAHPKRRTIGIRIPNNAIIQSLLKHLGEPVMSVSLSFLELSKSYNNSSQEIANYLKNQIDFFVDTGDFCPAQSTVIDCCGEAPEVVRQGIGEV